MEFKDLDLLSIGHTKQIVGAVYQGDGQTLVCMFPGEGLAGFHTEELKMTLPEWQEFIRQTDILEVEILEQAADAKVAKAIVRKSARQVSQHVSWEVYRRDGFQCRYCTADDVPLTVDHLVTWETMGPSIVENLVTCCKKCNRTRGNLSYAEWLKHPYYVQVSKNLTEQTRRLNQDLLRTLPGIPRRHHGKGRR